MHQSAPSLPGCQSSLWPGDGEELEEPAVENSKAPAAQRVRAGDAQEKGGQWALGQHAPPDFRLS